MLFNKQNFSQVCTKNILLIVVVVLYSSKSLSFVTHVNEVTHVEIPGVSGADYQIKKKNGKLEILVNKSIASMQDFKGYSDPYVSSIKATSTGPNSFKIVILTKGDNIKVFDYLTDAPLALSVDFYLEDGVKSISSGKSNAKKKTKSKKIIKGLYERKLASGEFIKIADQPVMKQNVKVNEESDVDINLIGIKDESFDLNHFDIDNLQFKKDSIIESRGRIFLKYPILLKEDKDISSFLSKRISYKISQNTSSEDKKVQLLKKIYEAGNYKKFLTGINGFMATYPKSKYEMILSFMRADSLYYLSQKTQNKRILSESLSHYDKMITKYPKSPLRERTILFSAFIRVRLKDYMGAIRHFRSYLSLYPKSQISNQIKMYLAQNLIRVKNHKDAIKTFEGLIDNANKSVAQEAHFFIGDAYFDRKQYKKAIRAYNFALTNYSDRIKDFPNAIFNKAQAEFLEEKYRESLHSHKKFIIENRGHSYIPYALTRIGEILEIVGERKKLWQAFYNQSSLMGGDSSGASVAKMHTYSRQLASVKPAKVKKVFQLMKATQKNIDLPDDEEFFVFKVSDAFFERGNYKKATNILIDYFQNVKIPKHDSKFFRRIGRGISYQVRNLIEQKDFLKALKIYEKYDALWIRKSERLDFYVSKAEIYKNMNLYDKSLSQYKKYINKFSKLPSKEDVMYFEALPAMSDINLRIAEIYSQQGKFTNSKKYLDQVNKKDLSVASRDNYYYLLSEALFHGGSYNQSYKKIKRIKNLNTSQVGLATDLYIKKNLNNEIIDIIDEFLNKKNLESSELIDLEKNKSKALSKSPNKSKFYTHLKSVYEKYGDTKYDLNEEKYLLGNHYLSGGKIELASQVWAKIDEQSIWSKMAMESKKSKNWQKKYEKYIDRIPAMAEKKGTI